LIGDADVEFWVADGTTAGVPLQAGSGIRLASRALLPAISNRTPRRFRAILR